MLAAYFSVPVLMISSMEFAFFTAAAHCHLCQLLNFRVDHCNLQLRTLNAFLKLSLFKGEILLLLRQSSIWATAVLIRWASRPIQMGTFGKGPKATPGPTQSGERLELKNSTLEVVLPWWSAPQLFPQLFGQQEECSGDALVHGTGHLAFGCLLLAAERSGGGVSRCFWWLHPSQIA